MSSKYQEVDERIKKKPFSFKEFLLTYVVMLFLVGIQMGLIISPFFKRHNSILHIVVIMSYWIIISAAFLYVTNRQIKKVYDQPMLKLSHAAKEVANGDFSVYVEPFHTPDKYDYIDVMITDFNLMVQELGSIETLKNDFVSNVSHEIKTPLAIIRNYSTLIKKSEMSEETRNEYVETIIKTTDNLSLLVTNILRLNKLDNQEIEYPTDKYNVSNQVIECLLSFESLIDEKNIELEVELDDSVLINADENMLEIVWNNLISNAIKFTDKHGKIKIIQRKDADNFIVSIKDSGCGMEQQTIKHIFDKFYQGDTSHSGQGNGLGLALVHRIIEKNKGTISVTSNVGEGSTFTVNLPLTL